MMVKKSFLTFTVILLFLPGWWPSFAMSDPNSYARPVTFRYTPSIPASTVCIAGTFNNWNKSAFPLKLQTPGKEWTGVFDIPPGVYSYRFVVNGNTWLPDPNGVPVNDGNSNINSQLIVLPRDYNSIPGKLNDGVITASAVRHRPDREDIARIGKLVFHFKLRTRHDDVAGCTLLLSNKNGRSERVAMTKTDEDPLYDYWTGSASLPSLATVNYAFLLTDGTLTLRYGSDGVEKDTSAPNWFHLNPKQYPLLITPEWPRSSVFYQIFPDRFANGDASNDGPGVKPWGSKPTYSNRMGGDLKGVLDHFNYLKDLGINALYFNPIFTARSNHGYDTTDYMHVDPRFGSASLLRKLTVSAHKLGWHVILDGVFNHTGIDFFAFKSLRELGAASPYRNWYTIYKFPIKVADGQKTYRAWFGVPWLPKLNLDNPVTREYFLHIATYWIDVTHIDGWRLDAADQVDPSFWVDFRKAVKKADPNAFLVGEIWGDAHAWLQGDEFDSVMNYPWRFATLNFFTFDRSTPTEFAQILKQQQAVYPPAAQAVLFNLLGSHDTERILTLCKGNIKREEQAVLFQMTYPGTPCVYYGDEIGLEGGKDPDDRRCMIWDKSEWNTSLFQFYQNVIKLRNENQVLQQGEYIPFAEDDKENIFGYRRVLKKQHALILFNRSGKMRVIRLPLSEMGGATKVWFGIRSSAVLKSKSVEIKFGPRGAVVLGN